MTEIKNLRPAGPQTDGLLDWINAIPEDMRRVIVQVGVWRGDATLLFAPAFKRVIDVDPWRGNAVEGYTLDAVYADYLMRCGEIRNVQHLREPSIVAAAEFHDNTLHAVYIDAVHTRIDLLADVHAWLPKVVDGGYIGGHDYHEYWPGVIEAVDECFLSSAIEVFQDSSWLVRVER